jgi:hypothetical protein
MQQGRAARQCSRGLALAGKGRELVRRRPGGLVRRKKKEERRAQQVGRSGGREGAGRRSRTPLSCGKTAA